MKLKPFLALAALCLLTTLVTLARELTPADRKWSAVVEKKIASGPAVISTPEAARAELATNIAKKYGRTSRVEKTETGYRISVLPPASEVVVNAKE